MKKKAKQEDKRTDRMDKEGMGEEQREREEKKR